MDKALANEAQPQCVFLAYEGFLLTAEGNFHAAQSRHLECWQKALQSTDLDDKFAALFSRVWLDILDEKIGHEEIHHAAVRANTARKDANRFVQYLLPNLPLESLREICGHRKPRFLPIDIANQSESSLQASVNFHF